MWLRAKRIQSVNNAGALSTSSSAVGASTWTARQGHVPPRAPPIEAGAFASAAQRRNARGLACTAAIHERQAGRWRRLGERGAARGAQRGRGAGGGVERARGEGGEQQPVHRHAAAQQRLVEARRRRPPRARARARAAAVARSPPLAHGKRAVGLRRQRRTPASQGRPPAPSHVCHEKRHLLEGPSSTIQPARAGCSGWPVQPA